MGAIFEVCFCAIGIMLTIAILVWLFKIIKEMLQ